MAKSEKPKILAIVGPTASGKTALSICLAKRLNGEIISCDSMQVYRRMDIGTAKPSVDEMQGIVHHLIDVAEPDEPFSVAAYVEAAAKAAKDILSRGKLPILCGGTGLYLDSFLRGSFGTQAGADSDRRSALLDYAEQHGAHALHERLRAVDPESAAAIHENNVKRVVRALEIYESTGETKTKVDSLSREAGSPYDARVIGLDFPARELLRERIAQRIRIMLEQGLLAETRTLEEQGVFSKNGTAAQAIGYKELLPYLHGEESVEEAIERLTVATRRYAKRQLTWFRAKPYVQWLDATEAGRARSAEALADEAIARFSLLQWREETP